MDAVIPRPPLPPGPYLVVGLARSGVAAALALRERGEEVVGVDSGRVPDGGGRAAATPPGVAVHAGGDGVDLLAGAATRRQEPRRARRRRP